MDYLKVFLLSALPVIEIRGGVPFGIFLGLSVWEAMAVSFLGNIAIIVPWLIALAKLEAFFAENRYTAGCYGMLVRKVERKRELFNKYGKYALFLFVAVPLPTTGAWTACIASRMFRIPVKDTFYIIAAGVLFSGSLVLMKTLLLRGAF